MHTAGGYLDQKTRSPVSLGAAIAINGAIIGALLFSSPEFIRELPRAIPLIAPIEDPVPVPPEPPKQRTEPQSAPESHVTPSEAVFPRKDTGFTAEKITGDPPPIPGTGVGTGIVQDPPSLPVFVGPQIDGKYMSAFQPPYPPGKQRLGEEGVVVVRVLVGPDGRVKQVARVEAADDAFYKVTAEQALRKWRFKPATRDGVPVEGWREMTVRFELTD